MRISVVSKTKRKFWKLLQVDSIIFGKFLFLTQSRGDAEFYKLGKLSARFVFLNSETGFDVKKPWSKAGWTCGYVFDFGYMFVLAWRSRQVKAFYIELSILYHYIVCERILFCKDDVIGWSDVHCAAGATTKTAAVTNRACARLNHRRPPSL